MSVKPRKFRALVDLSYGPLSVPVLAGEVTSSLPPESVTWLLDQNLIVLVEDDAKKGWSL